MNAHAQTAEHSIHSDSSRDYLTLKIGEQRFGIPILQVQDVLSAQKVTKIPLAPPEVAGSLNLRGRIITAIDVRRRLGLPPREDNTHSMSVVVENHNELYSLVIDKIGDVMTLKQKNMEPTPTTLDPIWKEISVGVCRLEDELLVIMDVPKLLHDVDV